jgi:transposase-like protein
MSMARQSERSKKERYWRDVLRQWHRSGQTIRAFCDEYGLSEPSFYGWKRTIAERDQRHGAAEPAFVPVRVTPAAEAAALEVVAGPERVVRVPTGFDADTLRRLLAVLEEGSSC